LEKDSKSINSETGVELLDLGLEVEDLRPIKESRGLGWTTETKLNVEGSSSKKSLSS